MSRPFATRRTLLTVGILSLACAACDVTPEKIEYWKTSEKGPGKLEDTLKSSSVSADLRGASLSALVEIGYAAHLDDDLKVIPEADRKTVVHASVPRLVKLMQTGATPDGQTTRAGREAKDALFVVRAYAGPEDLGTIDKTLVEWLAADLAGRMSAGGQGGDKILAAIGAPAAARLADLVGDERTSENSRTEAARLLGQIGDAATRERGGAKLVEVARRQRVAGEGMLLQIGQIGGDHAVAYLTALAEDGHQTTELRQKALQALALRGDPASLPAALRLAGDRKAPGKVRDAAFDLAEKCGPTAVPSLVKLINDPDDLVRWRSVEAALSAGKSDAVVSTLEALPQGKPLSKDDLRSYVVHDLAAVGPPALAPLRQELASKSWVARIAAVEGIAEIGKSDDADRVAQLASDGTKLKGWSGGATIGSEAKAAADALRQKK